MCGHGSKPKIYISVLQSFEHIKIKAKDLEINYQIMEYSCIVRITWQRSSTNFVLHLLKFTVRIKGDYLSRWMNEEVNTLVEEIPSSHTLNSSSVGLEILTSGSELVESIIRRQTDGPNDGDVRLELGSTELRSKRLHELLQPGSDVVRRDCPHRIHLLLNRWVCNCFRGCDGHGEEEEEEEGHVLVFWRSGLRSACGRTFFSYSFFYYYYFVFNGQVSGSASCRTSPCPPNIL